MNTNKSKLCLMLVLFVSSVILGCSSISNEKMIVTTTAPNGEIIPTEKESPAEEEMKLEDTPNIFSVKIKESIVSLKNWDQEIDLEQILGKPYSSEIKKLGSGADTLSGSYTKILKYEGLLLEMFSPRENGEDYWISTISLTKPGYMTSKGIEVGDSLQELLDAYPKLHTVDYVTGGLNSDLYQIIDELESNHLEVEVKDGLVHRIKIYHLIP